MTACISTARMLCALVVALAAAADDHRRYKVSNRIIVAGFIAGLLLLFWSAAFHVGVTGYLTGLLSGFGMGLPIYALRGIGAADVKLFAVLGLILGRESIIRIVLLSMIMGVVIGIVEAVMKRQSEKPAGQKLHRFHYTYAILAAMAVAVV